MFLSTRVEVYSNHNLTLESFSFILIDSRLMLNEYSSASKETLKSREYIADSKAVYKRIAGGGVSNLKFFEVPLTQEIVNQATNQIFGQISFQAG